MPKNKKRKLTPWQAVTIGLMIPAIIFGSALGIKKYNEEPPVVIPEYRETYTQLDGDEVFMTWQSGDEFIVMIADIDEERLSGTTKYKYVDEIELEYYKGGIEVAQVRLEDDIVIGDVEDWMEAVAEKHSFGTIKNKYFPEPKTEESGF